MLAATRVVGGVAFAVADPWNVRAAGTIRIPRAAFSWALRRLIRRERPTAVFAPGPELVNAARVASRGISVGIVTGSLPTLPVAIASDLYPELQLHAPTRALQRVAVLAIAAVLHGNVPTRKYATTRHRTPLHAA